MQTNEELEKLQQQDAREVANYFAQNCFISNLADMDSALTALHAVETGAPVTHQQMQLAEAISGEPMLNPHTPGAWRRGRGGWW